MPARLRPSLSLALLLAACNDGGTGTSAGAATTTTTTAATTIDTATDPGAAPSSGEPTTAATATAATTDDATSTTSSPTSTSTTDAPDTTTTAVDPSTTAVDPGSTGTTAADTTGAPVVCGDGVVDPGETCDDGSGVGCDTRHDGGDGTCVPPGTCSPGHVLTGSDCVPEVWVDHVHIYVDNTCKMKIDPPSFAVQPGQKLRLDYHNHSADYPVDVWMHYNGGFTDLQPGATWMEKYEHCFGPDPSEGWAEISTACSQVVLPITCL
jgi:hypothetical protein